MTYTKCQYCLICHDFEPKTAKDPQVAIGNVICVGSQIRVRETSWVAHATTCKW